MKLGGRFADSAGEEVAGNISDFLGPIFAGATKEITSKVSELFRDTA